jgi:hypothetical protein
MTLGYFSLELLGAIIVYCIGMEKRKDFRRKLLGIIIIYLLFTIAIQCLVWYYVNAHIEIERMYGTGGNNIITLLIFAVLVAMPILILYQIRARELIYCVTCAYLTEHMAYSLRILINYIFCVFQGKEYGEAVISNPGQPVYFLIHILVYLTAYFIFARKIIQNRHYSATALQSVGLMIAVAFLVICMSVLATIYNFEPIHAVYALFACYFVLYSQVKQQRELNLQQELSLQQQVWIKYKSHYEMSKETIDVINMKCHDLKHQVAALRSIQNLETQQKAIDSIEDAVMIYDSFINTGNEILDTTLTEKGLLCQQKGITLSCIADGESISFMDPVDLYSLFGNAIDNAMEGVENLSEGMRGITLTLQKKAGLIILQIENPYQGEIKLQDGLPLTSKEDVDYHGFGMKSMVWLAQKYHGFINIKTDHQVFIFRMTIPEPEKKDL